MALLLSLSLSLVGRFTKSPLVSPILCPSTAAACLRSGHGRSPTEPLTSSRAPAHCVPLKDNWSPNPWEPEICPYVEIGSLQLQSSENEITSISSNPIWLASLWAEETRRHTHTGKMATWGWRQRRESSIHQPRHARLAKNTRSQEERQRIDPPYGLQRVCPADTWVSSSLQKCETINFCLCKQPGLWYFCYSSHKGMNTLWNLSVWTKWEKCLFL